MLERIADLPGGVAGVKASRRQTLHFVQAELRTFGFDDVDEATAWASGEDR